LISALRFFTSVYRPIDEVQSLFARFLLTVYQPEYCTFTGVLHCT